MIGRVNFRSDRRLFGIKRTDRRQHMYVIGKTGTGKSTTLLTMIAQDIARGEGIAVIDPHGDLAERVLDLVPPRRINDVIYFDPSDIEYPIGFNILEIVQPNHPDFQSQRVLVSSGVISVFKKLWADSWGPRLEHFLRNAVLALLDAPGSTLLGVSRIFSDEAFRERIVNRCRDPVVRDFWIREFPGYNAQFRAEAASPIQNKVGQFLSTSLIRNIVGQSQNGFDLSEVMNSGKIFVANLAKGKIGEDNSALLGALLITRFQIASMARATVGEDDRRDFYLYVDEFQNFATESFANVLSESRKYHLSLILTHQYTAQINDELLAAILGNVGTYVAFRTGSRDGMALEEEYGRYLQPPDFSNQENHAAYIKLVVNGIPRPPFSMNTVLSTKSVDDEKFVQKIVTQSRLRFSRPKHLVEVCLKRWASPTLEY